MCASVRDNEIRLFIKSVKLGVRSNLLTVRKRPDIAITNFFNNNLGSTLDDWIDFMVFDYEQSYIKRFGSIDNQTKTRIRNIFISTLNRLFPEVRTMVLDEIQKRSPQKSFLPSSEDDDTNIDIVENIEQEFNNRPSELQSFIDNCKIPLNFEQVLTGEKLDTYMSDKLNMNYENYRFEKEGNYKLQHSVIKMHTRKGTDLKGEILLGPHIYEKLLKDLKASHGHNPDIISLLVDSIEYLPDENGPVSLWFIPDWRLLKSGRWSNNFTQIAQWYVLNPNEKQVLQSPFTDSWMNKQEKKGDLIFPAYGNDTEGNLFPILVSTNFKIPLEPDADNQNLPFIATMNSSYFLIRGIRDSVSLNCVYVISNWDGPPRAGPRYAHNEDDRNALMLEPQRSHHRQ